MPRFLHCVASGHGGLWHCHLTDATHCENKGTPGKRPGPPGFFPEAHFSMSGKVCFTPAPPGSTQSRRGIPHAGHIRRAARRSWVVLSRGISDPPIPRHLTGSEATRAGRTRRRIRVEFRVRCVRRKGAFVTPCVCDADRGEKQYVFPSREHCACMTIGGR
jgi:hypothetical protein